MWIAKNYGVGTSKRTFAVESTSATEAYTKSIHESYETEFENPEQYIKAKLEMLMTDMWIEPTEEEIAHLNELKTRGDIDRAVHSIIDRHWDEEC